MDKNPKRQTAFVKVPPQYNPEEKFFSNTKITAPIIKEAARIFRKLKKICLPLKRPIFLRNKNISKPKLNAPDNAVANASPPTLKGFINVRLRIILTINAATAALTGVLVSLRE